MLFFPAQDGSEQSLALQIYADTALADRGETHLSADGRSQQWYWGRGGTLRRSGLSEICWYRYGNCLIQAIDLSGPQQDAVRAAFSDPIRTSEPLKPT